MAFGQIIFSEEFVTPPLWESELDARRYMVFGQGGEFGGVVKDADGETVSQISDVSNGTFGYLHNGNANNPVPSFTYLPVNVAWQPNTIYSIDFLVGQRSAGDFRDGAIEFGLWDGFPSDDDGPGNYQDNDVIETFEAQTRQSLGTEGFVRIDSDFIGNGNAMLVSELLKLNNPGDQAFTFTTGEDVSELGPMVLFLRGPEANRAHFDNVEISAIPEPGTYALFAGLVALVGTGLLRRLRKRNT